MSLFFFLKKQDIMPENQRRLAGCINFLFSSQLFISICAAAFYCAGFKLQLGALNGLSVLRVVLVFAGTLAVYNITGFVMRFGIVSLARWLKKRTALMLAGALLVLAVLVFLPIQMLDWKEICYLGMLGLVSFLYNFPADLELPAPPLRSVPLIKIVLIAFVWANLGAVYPAVSMDEMLGWKNFFYFLTFFSFIFSITLPFDIRDYYKDEKARLLTFPRFIGIRKTKQLSIVAWLCFSLFSFLVSVSLWKIIVLSLFGIPLLLFSSPRRSHLYYTGLVDGLILLLSVLLLLN